MENYSSLIEYCIKENISPGGSADLLALSIFIYLLIHDDKNTIIYKQQQANEL